MACKSVLVLSALVVVASAQFFPIYIRRCKEGETRCAIDSANAALPTLLKGNSQLSIPSFFPLLLGDTEIEEDALRLNLNNCQLHGFEHVNVYYMSATEQYVKIGLVMQRLSLTAEIPAGGNVGDLTLPRSGIGNFTFNKVDVNFKIVLTSKKDDAGLTRLFPFKIDVVAQPEESKFTFSEFLTGTVPYLSVKNSKKLEALVLPKVQEALKEGYLQTAGRLLALFPKESFYIPAYL